MSEELLYKLIAIFGAGAGLLFAAGTSLLRCSRMGAAHAGLGAFAAASGGLLTAAFIPWSYAIGSASVAVVAFGVLTLIKFSLFTKITTVARNTMRRPLGQSVVLASFGVAAMVGSTYYLVAEDEAHINADMELMLQTTWRPDTRITSNDSAVTDAGTPIALHEPVSARGEAEINSIEKHIVSDMRFSGLLIRIAPPTDTHNCHGWVFTGGKYWLGPDDVQRILADNKYERVSEPRTGDIVIYRQGNNITHTAIVRSPAANGRPILVEGKWGWMGVYLHAIDDSSYGKCHEFYRSPRDGHLLVGLGGHSNDVDRRSDRPIPQTPSGN